MTGNIVTDIIIIILVIGVIIFTYALMKAAGKYDKISNEDWEEYCRRQIELEENKKHNGSDQTKK